MGFAEDLDRDLQTRAEKAFRQLAVEVRDDTKRLVRRQVQYLRVGKRVRVIRSKPGQPPRRETGDYQDSIQSAVTVEADRITASIYTNSKIGVYLEHGTEKMESRPHWSRIYDRWLPKAAKRIGELMYYG